MPKKQKYNILMTDGTKKEVEGEIFNDIWGIDKRTVPYDKQTLKDGTERTLSYTSYIITHIPTGAQLTLGAMRTLKSAKLMLSEPEFFFDELNEKAVKEMGKAIKRFMDAHDWKD